MDIYDTNGRRWLCDIDKDDFAHAMRMHRKTLSRKSGAMIHGFSCYLPEEPHRYRCVRPEDINLPMTLDLVKPPETPTLKGIGR